jgi:hypothetical protein
LHRDNVKYIDDYDFYIIRGYTIYGVNGDDFEKNNYKKFRREQQ